MIVARTPILLAVVSKPRDRRWKLSIRALVRLSCVLLVMAAQEGCHRKSPESTGEALDQAQQLDQAQPIADPISESAVEPAAAAISQPASELATEVESVENTAITGGAQASLQPGLLANATPGVPSDQWTTRRIVALHETGPIVIDLTISLNEKSIARADEEQLTRAVEEIYATILLTPPPAEDSAADIDASNAAEKNPPDAAFGAKAVSWDSLLELPLIRSGWLGNLVPDDEQRAELIGLVDEDGDGFVAKSELHRLLSRGLSQTDPLLIRDLGQAEADTLSASPWGIADENGDYALDSLERERFSQRLSMRDLNADGMVTRREISSRPQEGDATAPQMMNRGRGSFLSKESLLILEQPDLEGAPPGNGLDSTPQANQMASAILRHYTFLAMLERSLWPAWSDSQWNAIDANSDQLLDKHELKRIASVLPQMQVAVSWLAPRMGSPADGVHPAMPSGDKGLLADAQPSITFYSQTVPPQSNSIDGQIWWDQCALRIETIDDFSSANRQTWRRLLEQALSVPTLKAYVSQRLELQESGFDLLDSDGDQQLSDDEFAQAWNWLTVRQGNRISAEWLLSASPWFQLSDIDGDQRISVREREQIAVTMGALDRDGDGVNTPNELPLVVTLRLRRSDSRLAPPEGITQANLAAGDLQQTDEDWFSAMDTNRDGSLGRGEFLGDRESFNLFDTDGDGWIDRAEAVQGTF
jgi:Ca2+-binding EF-hand superfamily protein